MVHWVVLLSEQLKNRNQHSICRKIKHFHVKIQLVLREGGDVFVHETEI